MESINKNISWAKKEVDIACKSKKIDRDFAYNYKCCESALKAYISLMEDGHNGLSLHLTKYILNRLIDGKILTPIKDVDDIWTHVGELDVNNGYSSYQCKRMSSLFKRVYTDGTVKYSDCDSCYCISINNPSISYHSKLVHNIIDELYPITMPYYPGKPIVVYCEDFLTNKSNGNLDTIGIFYAVEPNGKKTHINRYFKESDNGWVEIDKIEYKKRKEIRINKYDVYKRKGNV